jgi:SAM-dependent methyltransferase
MALGADRKIKILSYGCSIGDEVFSLRRYFPRAVIKGIDINPANIAVCRRRLKKLPDTNISLTTANGTGAETSGDYDAIFCMAVLPPWQPWAAGSNALRPPHPVRGFCPRLADFERCLKPGGLLIIRHSNFRLCDAPAGQAFETILRVPANPTTR